MMLNTEKVKNDMDILIRHHHKLKFLLSQIKNGKLEVCTWTNDGFRRMVEFEDLLEILERQEDWESGYL